MKKRNGFVSNSSSSSFIVDYGFSSDKHDYTIPQIEQILTDMLEMYNKIFNNDKTYAETFKKPKVIDDKEIDFLSDWLPKEDATVGAVAKLVKLKKNKNKYTYKVDSKWYVIDCGYNNRPDVWKEVTDAQEILGKIVIYSASDNSIPYELFDMMENKFNCSRIHMG